MTGDTTIRRATPADAAAVRALTRAAYAKWVPLIGREPLPMAADYDHAVAAHLVDLLESGGELLALIETIPEADHLLIENVAVRPDQQGKGLGERLLAHADELARTLGFDELRLYTNAAFAANVAFYAKRGYAEHRRTTAAIGTTVFMRKRLA
ncbi:MAG: GNAT family N-acetyltransferase [Rhodospirillales bacterium]|nr:MAG: GNAT family N-acetyltransferase [Rhodospirillales bacterium]